MDTQDAQARRDGIRSMWAAGSYAAIGDKFASIGRGLAAELDVAGRAVLDAACGTGNTTLALAEAGADVVGVDLTPELLDVAAARAAERDLRVTLVEGDLVDLPFEDDRFEVVTSTFGAFTADDPWACARELARVCAPGGTIAVTAWSREGAFAPLRAIAHELVPDAMAGRPEPEAWADADGLADRFAGTSAELADLDVRDFAFRFVSLDEAFDFFEENSGPMMSVRDMLQGAGADWGDVRRRIIEGWAARAREVDGGVELHAPYARALLQVT